MTMLPRILKNMSVLFAAEIVTKILSFFLVILLTRYLGDYGFGQYSFIIATTGLLYLFFDFGMWDFALKEFPRHMQDCKRYLDNIIPLQAAIGVVFALPVALYLATSGHDPSFKLSFALGYLLLFLMSFSDSMRVVFKVHEEMEYDSLERTVEKAISFGGGVAALAMGHGLVGFFLVLIAAKAVSLGVSFIILRRRYFRPGIAFDLAYWRYLLVSGSAFFFMIVFYMIHFQIDTIMIKLFHDFAVVGWYDAAYKLVTTLTLLPNIILIPVLPVMTRSFIDDRRLLIAIYRKLFRYLFILFAPIAVGTTLLAGRIIGLVYTDQFANSALALQILIWAELFVVLSFLTKTVLVSIDRQKDFTYLIGASALLNIFLNLYMIPRYSYVGAGITTVITEGIVFVVSYLVISKRLARFSLLRLWKPAVAAAAMGIAVHLIRPLNLFAIIAVAALVYAGLILLLREVTGEDLALVRKGVLPWLDRKR
ncbi:flippase [Candidatus Woesearchaeota archaeon]|nr:flippase [Candidatus Woesearchaeota archaeon]